MYAPAPYLRRLLLILHRIAFPHVYKHSLAKELHRQEEASQGSTRRLSGDSTGTRSYLTERLWQFAPRLINQWATKEPLVSFFPPWRSGFYSLCISTYSRTQKRTSYLCLLDVATLQNLNDALFILVRAEFVFQRGVARRVMHALCTVPVCENLQSALFSLSHSSSSIEELPEMLWWENRLSSGVGLQNACCFTYL